MEYSGRYRDRSISNPKGGGLTVRRASDGIGYEYFYDYWEARDSWVRCSTDSIQTWLKNGPWNRDTSKLPLTDDLSDD